MNKQFSYFWQLPLLSLVLLIAGIFVIPVAAPDLSINAYIITILAFTVINLVSYLFMYSGIRKNDREGVVVLLAGIGMKFLLYLIYILVFWMITKKLLKPFILTFFALYLAFTFLLSLHLFKVLKDK